MVLGGGPAGLVAAITAATGGHRIAMTELAAGVQGSTATQAIIGRRTYQDLPTLTQHYWDLSRSEPTNSLRTPLIRVVWGVSRNRETVL